MGTINRLLANRSFARAPAHPIAPALRRADAARTRRGRPIAVNRAAIRENLYLASLIFRKGLDLKDAVAGMLAESYHSAVVDRIKCVPRFSADARGPTLVVREPRGVKRRGRFVGGKFKPV